MLKPVVVASAIALAGTPAMADVYFNPEVNAGFSGSEYSASSLELHVGFEEGPWYVQAGPAMLNDGSSSEWGLSAKTGMTVPISSKADIYGELSYAKFEDADAGYGMKLGAKYFF